MSDQREFYRIKQRALLEYQVISVADLDQHAPDDFFAPCESIELINKFKKLTGESSVVLQKLSQQNRLLADYLYNLEARLDLLEKNVFKESMADTHATEYDIDLSEGGLSFESEKALYKGRILAISLVLLPQYQPLRIFSQVIHHEVLEGRHSIGLKFINPTPEQCQVLAKAVMKAQLAKRKKQKTGEQP